MDNPLDFSGKTVFVTGGGKGVGRGISECFLAAGASVVICGRKTPETLPAVGSAQAWFLPCDVRDHAQLEDCITRIVDRHGSL
ncbi:MAG TPA: SDR family NAD(P)-dependent oxidoreductase, partial [Kineobactrum sp.]